MQVTLRVLIWEDLGEALDHGAGYRRVGIFATVDGDPWAFQVVLDPEGNAVESTLGPGDPA